jgi:iron(II)-dependent oxidoreductase
VTFEPGGQVELSTPPFPELESCDALATDAAALGRTLADAGIGLVGLGLDPGPQHDREVRSPRYDAMEAYFDLTGPAGRTMMRSTAAIQVNVDLGTGPDVDRRWRRAHGLGPVLAAAFANSPFEHGVPSGWRSTRLAVWRAVDPGRTEPVDGEVGGRAAWARYALDAGVMLVRAGDEEHVPVLEPLSFADWIDRGHALGWPTLDDLEYHLTTLFPPVRPRGWLELRMIDSVPAPWARAAAAVTSVLLHDAEAGARAGFAVEPVRDRWLEAARDGLASPDLAAAARECFAAALDALPRSGADDGTVAAVEDFVDRYVARGRCPADDRLDEWDATGALLPCPDNIQPDNIQAVTRGLVAEHLEHARARTLAMLDGLGDDDLGRQVSPLMSPLVWDLAHIGHYEELWLLRNLAGAAPTDPHFDDVYDAFRHPRRERPSLRVLDARDARGYLASVRARVLDGLDGAALDGSDPLLAGAFVYGMVVQHEHQHDETMLATVQLMERALPEAPAFAGPAFAGAAFVGPGSEHAAGAGAGGDEVALPGGAFVMGTDAEPWAYDNERPAHEVVVAPFSIDRTPVTNRRFAEFIADGGYDDPRLWTETGWKWRMEADLAHPQFWRRETAEAGTDAWTVLRFGQRLELPAIAAEPVQHVCWYEADAYSRWAGKRLPTETEWEYAAAWGPDGRKRRYPWGDGDPDDARANLGQTRLGPGPDGARPAGASGFGVEQMVGDVWEWAASDFTPYPGFRSFPYREYSEVFFPGPGEPGEYKVLRGGSWATHPSAVRTTFRNWDYPIRRQIFSGFRCARDT